MNELESLRDYFARVEQVSLAYLFGSRASGQVGPLSDYDFGVLVASPTAELRYRLSRDLGRILDAERIDLVFLNQAPVELAYTIIAQGQLVYQQDVGARVEFEAGVLSRYGDYLPVLRQQRQHLLEGDQHDTRIRRYRAALGRTVRTLAAIRAAQGQKPA